jgi:hypothetical protein
LAQASPFTRIPRNPGNAQLLTCGLETWRGTCSTANQPYISKDVFRILWKADQHDRLYLDRVKTNRPFDMNGANQSTPHAAKVLLLADELHFLCDLLREAKHLAEYRAGFSEITSSRASPANRSVANETLLNKLSSYLREMR